MINFFYEGVAPLGEEEAYRVWLERIIVSEHYEEGSLNFIFCNDAYLLELNKSALGHDTYTDIITMDYKVQNLLHGDIYISTERVTENSRIFGVDTAEELRRVLAHGILHLCGYGDKTAEEIAVMRTKEEEKMKLFHVEQS